MDRFRHEGEDRYEKNFLWYRNWSGVYKCVIKMPRFDFFFLWFLDECLGTNESLFSVFVVVWRVGSKICSILIRDIHWVSWNTKYLFVVIVGVWEKNPFRKTSLGCKFCLTFDQRILTAYLWKTLVWFLKCNVTNNRRHSVFCTNSVFVSNFFPIFQREK